MRKYVADGGTTFLMSDWPGQVRVENSYGMQVEVPYDDLREFVAALEANRPDNIDRLGAALHRAAKEG